MSAPSADAAPAPAPIRVMIVEDRHETREGLAALIDGTDGFRCVGRFRSMEDALEGLRPPAPDVILMDIGLPGMSGIEGVRLLTSRFPALSVLMLTVYDDDERIFDAMCAGACGYLLKKTPPGRLLYAIREAHEGGAPMSPEVARKVIRAFQMTGPPEKFDENLTPQEQRLLKLLSEGNSYQEIADHLGISVNTVRTYIRSVYEKLHVHSRSEAVSKALRNRLIY